MTAIKRILLTSDDGYNSPGLRLVIAALKDKYQLQVCATANQQSGVGGLLTIMDGFNWQKTEIDGVPAISVSGSPCDAMELASIYFEEKFDLIISGVNWGANLGSAIHSSGTVNAVIRALSLQLAPRGIALSWDLPVDFYYRKHNGDDELKPFLKYPGRSLDKLLDLSFSKDFWQAQFLNINFPKKSSQQTVIVPMTPYVNDVYTYHSLVDRHKNKGRYIYVGERTTQQNPDKFSSDLEAIAAGYISISPCKIDFLDAKSFAQYKKKEYSL